MVLEDVLFSMKRCFNKAGGCYFELNLVAILVLASSDQFVPRPSLLVSSSADVLLLLVLGCPGLSYHRFKPGEAWSHQELEEAREEFCPRPFRGTVTYRQLDF